mmetsp:Transcript_64831/g.138869  ORF Transcript_64831/g.138869 Transcript_64831/m.138869 type:complete len:334 (-) Transcript_64831:53-1054(-)
MVQVMRLQGGFRRRQRSAAASLLCAIVGLLGACALGSQLFVAPSTAPRGQGQEVTATVPDRVLAAAAQPAAATSAIAASGAAMALLGAAAAATMVSLGLRVQRRGASAPRASEPRRTALQARGGGEKGPLVVIAGPPAAGKGTQCDKIKDKYGYVHISTGDILRENVKQGTDLGKKAKEFMDAGALVPSELIVDLVKDRLAKDDVKEKGCLLDGFPRAPDQAQAMSDAGITVDKFLVIKVPDDTLVERGCGRRLDPETGDIYHMKFKPPPADIMDRLVHRSDDQEEAIRERLKIYHAQIDGITPFFKEVVVDIDGTGKPDDVFTLVTGGLDGI